MTRGVRRLSGIGILLIAIGFPLAVGFAPKGAAHSTPAPRAPLSLTSMAAADAYLRSLGVDPTTAVHQTGVRNYAGPSCPGAGWNCAAAAGAVVQQAAADGVNEFTCTASSGDSQANDSCVIVQMAPSSGDNEAICKEEVSGTAPNASCSITQQNVGGDNQADIDQQWQQQSGSTQTAQQTATVTQQNQKGANKVDVDQAISQLIENSSPTQDQEAVQVACVQQDSPSGGNHASVTQQVSQNEEEQGTSTQQFQNQNAGPDTSCGGSSTTISPNLAAIVLQDEGTPSASGRGSESVHQVLHQTMTSLVTDGSVQQQQGNDFDLGGLEAIPNQQTTGLATASVGQHERQLEDAETKPSSRSQIQNDPIHNPCCEGVQGSNPSDTFDLTQKSVQDADSGATQLFDMQGDCTSSGVCDVFQVVRNDTTSQSQECTPGPCSVVLNNEGEGSPSPSVSPG